MLKLLFKVGWHHGTWAYAPESCAQANPSRGTIESGDEAPRFSITLYQGGGELGTGLIDFPQNYGKPVVLNFWAGLCPPCRDEMPVLQKVYPFYYKLTVCQFPG